MLRDNVWSPSVPSLLELQRIFAADLQDSRSNELGGLIVGGNAGQDRRFNIYRNNIWSAQTGALANIYPVIRDLVGSAFFDHLAEKYIAELPLRQGNLQQFGAAMANFISGFGPVDHLPYLVDVAHLEWAYHRVFHAPDPRQINPFSFHRVSERDLCRMKFELGPACRLVHSAFPIFEIWRMHCDADSANSTVRLDQGPEAVLIMRHDCEVELHRLTPGCAALLDNLHAGENLGNALGAVLKVDPDIDLSAVFRLYVQSGVLHISSRSD